EPGRIAEHGERPGLGLDGFGGAEGRDGLAHALTVDDPGAGPFGWQQMHRPTMTPTPASYRPAGGPGNDTPISRATTRRHHMWCWGSAPGSTYGGARAGSVARQGHGGNREPGENPGLPRSGKRERPPSSALGPGPGKRRPVGGLRAGLASPKTCRRAVRDGRTVPGYELAR